MAVSTPAVVKLAPAEKHIQQPTPPATVNCNFLNGEAQRTRRRGGETANRSFGTTSGSKNWNVSRLCFVLRGAGKRVPGKPLRPAWCIDYI
jgi:hypothetical protein